VSITVSGALSGARPSGWSLTEGLNRGWDATLSFGKWKNTRFSATAATLFTVADRFGQSITSPAMLASERGRSHGGTRLTEFNFIDATSWELSNGSQSWDTFLGGTMADIIDAVASRYTVTISGGPTLPIHQEDFKLTSGQAIVQRVARVAGKVMTIGTDDGLALRNWDWTDGAAAFRPSKRGGVKENYRPLERFGRVFVTKTTGLGTSIGPQYYDFTAAGNVTEELAFPLGAGAYPEYVASVGTVGWVTLWDGPPDSGGNALGTWPLTGDSGDEFIPAATGTWPATHLTAIVYPDTTGSSLPLRARLKVSGAAHSTLPVGIDGAIAQEFGTGRGTQSPFSDSLIPSLAHATSTWPAWLVEANRGTNTLTARGPLQCGVRVGQTWGWAPWGLSGRIEQVKHSGVGKSSGTEITVNCDIAA
jgi:hypothetical protein